MTVQIRRVRSVQRRMSFAAFDRSPRQMGWKYEYRDGKALIFPAKVFVPFEIELTESTADDNPSIRAVTPGDLPALRKGFHEAFRTVPEYAHCSNAEYSLEVEKYFQDYFHSLRGEPMSASCAVFTDSELIGAAIIVRNELRTLLDCLFVRPKFARNGWAATLVTWAASALFRAGVTRLRSYAMQANEPSLRWHERFGFREVSDVYVARHRYRFYRDEFERHQRSNDLSDEDLKKLDELRHYWFHESDRLDEDRFQEYLKNKKTAERTR
jgi:ribosomal protein S18 acetylase RimI-like enzyme